MDDGTDDGMVKPRSGNFNPVELEAVVFEPRSVRSERRELIWPKPELVRLEGLPGESWAHGIVEANTTSAPSDNAARDKIGLIIFCCTEPVNSA